MHVTIVANAPVADLAPFEALLHSTSRLIAADGGVNALYQIGLLPQLLIGDLDSASPEALDWVTSQGVAVRRLPAEKDETDLELALLEALACGATAVDVLGALGGRIDQTLANVQMLAMTELAGLRVRLLALGQEVLVVRAGERLELIGQPGDTVSLLPITGSAEGITIEGFYYPLSDATLRPDRARGVSNLLLTGTGTITLRHGILLVVHAGAVV